MSTPIVAHTLPMKKAKKQPSKRYRQAYEQYRGQFSYLTPEEQVAENQRIIEFILRRFGEMSQ